MNLLKLLNADFHYEYVSRSYCIEELMPDTLVVINEYTLKARRVSNNSAMEKIKRTIEQLIKEYWKTIQKSYFNHEATGSSGTT